MSFRLLNTPISIAVCVMAVALAGCGSQATDPVRFSKVMVISSDGTSIQLVADMCQGQPYKTVVKESADVLNIQQLGTGKMATLRAAAQTLSRFDSPRLCYPDECTTRLLAQTSPCRVPEEPVACSSLMGVTGPRS